MQFLLLAVLFFRGVPSPAPAGFKQAKNAVMKKVIEAGTAKSIGKKNKDVQISEVDNKQIGSSSRILRDDDDNDGAEIPALSGVPLNSIYTEDTVLTLAPSVAVTTTSILTQAEVKIMPVYTGDVLGARISDPRITSSYNPINGILLFTGSATPSSYTKVLRGVVYLSKLQNNFKNAEGENARLVRWRVWDIDGQSNNPFDEQDVAIVATADAPMLMLIPGSHIHSSGTSSLTLAPSISVADQDTTNMASASVQIIGYRPGDTLTAMVSEPGISASFDSSSGTLTLIGTGSQQAYTNVLRGIVFRSTVLPGPLSWELIKVNDHGAVGTTIDTLAVPVTTRSVRMRRTSAPLTCGCGWLFVIELAAYRSGSGSPIRATSGSTNDHNVWRYDTAAPVIYDGSTSQVRTQTDRKCQRIISIYTCSVLYPPPPPLFFFTRTHTFV